MEGEIVNYSGTLSTISSELVTLGASIDKLYSVVSLLFFCVVILIALHILRGV